MASFNIFINYETFHILYIDKHDQALSLIYIYIYRERERELLQKHKYQFYQNPKATNHKSNNENSSRK